MNGRTGSLAGGVPLLLFGISFCLLAHEIALMRLLAFLQWYHFAYLIISLALLGFAASGTIMHLCRDYWLAHAKGACLAAVLATALVMALGRQLMAVIPMDLFLAVWQPARLLWLALLCLILFLPFLFGAFAIILIFSCRPERIGSLYAANLLGSGAGSIGALFMLTLWHPLAIPYVLALTIAAFCLLLLPFNRQQVAAVCSCVAVAVICTLWPSTAAMSGYKPIARTLLMPDARVIHESHDAHGVIHVVRSKHLRAASGLSLSFRGEVPARPVVFVDGEPVGSLPLGVRPGKTAYLRQTLMNLPYRIRQAGNVLVLDAGTGLEVQRAQMERATNILAIEENRHLLRVMRQLPGHASVYDAAGVQTVISDARAYLWRDGGRFNLIVLPPAGSFSGIRLGMGSLYENYLFTTQSVERMLVRLTAGGMIVASAWLDTPMRRPLRLFALLAEGMRRAGINDPGRHILVLRSWNMAVLLASRRPFTANELAQAVRFAREKGFDLAFPAAYASKTPRHRLAEPGLPDKLAGLANNPPRYPDIPFHLEPPTDDRPYFSHFLSLQAAQHLLKTVGMEGMLLQEWAYVLAGVTLILLLLAGSLLVLLPLGLSQRRLQKASTGLGYFAAIGAGFMFVEMLMIQKLVLLLGEPVYAVAVVLAALLIFAGLGSLFSGRLDAAVMMRLVMQAMAVLILLLAGLWFSYPWCAQAAASLDTAWRFAIAIAMIAPAGFVMGLFFPTGILALAQTGREALIPWAWGINGFVSVISPPLALLVSLNFGFAVLGVLALACYLAASVLHPTRLQG